MGKGPKYRINYHKIPKENSRTLFDINRSNIFFLIHFLE